MKHPPYHLKGNKAVDRILFGENLKVIGGFKNLKEYTYYGFGGPYLEEFRILHEMFPEVKLVSIEKDSETIKRQKFHLPCRKVELKHCNMKTFITTYSPDDKNSIFWLDYTMLKYSYIEDVQALLGKMTEGSVLKVTLRANASDYLSQEAQDRFLNSFAKILPDSTAPIPITSEEFVVLVQDMLKISIQTAIAGLPISFQPISAFFYSDGVEMYTLTGMVCGHGDETELKRKFKNIPFTNLKWDPPSKIAVPVLSTKERLHLQGRLPCNKNAGKVLHKRLGYLIGNNASLTEESLIQYSSFYKYYPYFVKAIP